VDGYKIHNHRIVITIHKPYSRRDA